MSEETIGTCQLCHKPVTEATKHGESTQLHESCFESARKAAVRQLLGKPAVEPSAEEKQPEMEDWQIKEKNQKEFQTLFEPVGEWVVRQPTDKGHALDSDEDWVVFKLAGGMMQKTPCRVKYINWAEMGRGRVVMYRRMKVKEEFGKVLEAFTRHEMGQDVDLAKLL